MTLFTVMLASARAVRIMVTKYYHVHWVRGDLTCGHSKFCSASVLHFQHAEIPAELVPNSAQSGGCACIAERNGKKRPQAVLSIQDVLRVAPPPTRSRVTVLSLLVISMNSPAACKYLDKTACQHHAGQRPWTIMQKLSLCNNKCI